MLQEYNFDEIYIRHAIDEAPDDKYFTMHIHDHCEIYFFLSGNVEYLVEGSRYPLEEYSLILMRPAESHKAKILDNSKYERYALNFPLSFADSIDPQQKLMKPFVNRQLGKNNMLNTTDLDMQLVHRLFTEMCSEESDYDKQLTIKTHLYILLDLINRAFQTKETVNHEQPGAAERIIAYVNLHLFEELSIPTLAKHFYLSPSQFNRVFKQATGAAPWEYITKKRLTAAKELLRVGHTAQYACEHCGFGDYSSFYRAYLKHFGCAPKKDC